ncbi:MAG: MarR family transcriptional regulator [Dehalococcoidia bacterium]|nr:MarR family transcriptional regulator [Dehalococcoidia bacterium]
MTRTPNAAELAAWRAFLAAHARVTETLEKELEEAAGLPLGWYDVLVQLDESEAGRLRMHDLARAVLLSRAGLTRLVDRMCAAGLVAREACESDRRGRFVALTAAGREALHRAAPAHLAGVYEHFSAHLSPAQAESLRAVLERVLAAQPLRH